MSDCPCLISDKPCHPDCTCINPLMSHGCRCCARYGSPEQRIESANRIVSKTAEPSMTGESCVYCKMSIWENESVINDKRGTFHPHCFEKTKYIEALRIISTWAKNDEFSVQTRKKAMQGIANKSNEALK